MLPVCCLDKEYHEFVAYLKARMADDAADPSAKQQHPKAGKHKYPLPADWDERKQSSKTSWYKKLRPLQLGEDGRLYRVCRRCFDADGKRVSKGKPSVVRQEDVVCRVIANSELPKTWMAHHGTSHRGKSALRRTIGASLYVEGLVKWIEWCAA